MSSALKSSCWPCSSRSSWKPHDSCEYRAMSAAGLGRRSANGVGRVVAFEYQIQGVLGRKKMSHREEGGYRLVINWRV